jgi:hypothetical protein
VARVSAKPEWLSPEGAAFAALEQAQANGVAIAVLTTAFIEWSTKMTDAMGRAEAAAEQDTLEDELARQTIADLRAGQAELKALADAAVANAQVDADARAQLQQQLDDAYARADALATKLAGSSPIDTSTLPPTETPGPVTDPNAPHPDQTLPGDLPSS